MSIGRDHNCAADCPVCIAKADLSKFANTRKIDSNSTFIKWAIWLINIVVAMIAIRVASALYNQAHQSHGKGTSITLAQGLEAIELLSKDISHSSIGVAERLEVFESLSKRIRFSLSESAHLMAATAASPSEKKPDAPAARHPTDTGFLFLQFAVVRVLSMLLYIIMARRANSRAARHPTGTRSLFLRIAVVEILCTLLLIIMAERGGYLADTLQTRASLS